MWVSTALLAFRTGRQGGREDNKLEPLACYFAKLGIHRLPWIEVQVLVTKPD